MKNVQLVVRIFTRLTQKLRKYLMQQKRVYGKRYAMNDIPNNLLANTDETAIYF